MARLPALLHSSYPSGMRVSDLMDGARTKVRVTVVGLDEPHLRSSWKPLPWSKLEVALPPVGEAPAGRTQEHLTSRSSERRIPRFRLLRGTDGQGRPQRSRHGALLRVALRAVEPSGAGPWATRRFPQAKRGTRAVETVAMDGTVEAGGRVLDGYVLPFRVRGSRCACCRRPVHGPGAGGRAVAGAPARPFVLVSVGGA